MQSGSPLPRTEAAEDRYRGLDTWPDAAILSALLDGQRRAVAALEAALPALSEAATAIAARLSQGGRLVYLAAGTPALVSLGDALELPQTFGIARERIVLVLAGGETIVQSLAGETEDDADLARREIAAHGIGPADALIAVSASGSTPYTVGGLDAAKRAGAITIGIAGNAGSPLLAAAAIPVLLDVGPEVISGSTRMGAGTAQKAALNLLSTLVGVKLGHVHDNLMVNVVADNAKLRGRAERMVAAITGVEIGAAAAALATTGGIVKPAILIAAGATPDQANLLLARHTGVVRRALAELRR